MTDTGKHYAGFYGYKNYEAPNTIGGYLYGQGIIEIHKLLPLYWEQMAQNGEGDKAIEWWLKDMTLIQGMMGANSTIVEKAVWMVQYGLNLKALPLILKADPSLIEKYELQITNILNKDFMEEIWDVENTWRGEYSILRDLQITKIPHDLLIIKPNDTRNEFLKLAKDMVWLSRQPAHEIPNAYKLIKKRYVYNELYHFAFPYNIGKELTFSALLKGYEMYINGHIMTTLQRALILWMQAHSQDIPPEKMQGFLEQAPKHLYNNLTEKPFLWDKEKNAIYFRRDKDDPKSHLNIMYK